MNFRPQSLTFAALLAPALVLSACSHNVDPNRLPKSPKYPPPPPKQVSMAIDPKLLADARKTIQDAFTGRLPGVTAESKVVLRANAVEATQRTAGTAGSARILAALNDQSPLVRFAGAMAAGQIPVPAAYNRLLELIHDPDESVQVGVRFALHMLGDKRLSHDFEAYVQDPNPQVRANAVLALGLINEPSALKLLRSLKGESSAAVRLQVVESLYHLGDQNAGEELIVGTVSAYPDDQIVSMLALASTHNSTVAKSFLGQLTSDYPEVCLVAARALGEIGSDEGMAVALNGTHSRDPRQRALAALALGDIGRTDAQPALRPLLLDVDPAVRLAAATAVLQLKP